MKCNCNNRYNDETPDLRDYRTLLKEVYVASEEKMRENGVRVENTLKVSYIKGWVYICKLEVPGIGLHIVSPLQESDLAQCGRTFEQFESEYVPKIWDDDFSTWAKYVA